MPKAKSVVMATTGPVGQIVDNRVSEKKDVLTPAERAKLRSDESELEHHFGTFKIAGAALQDINQARLYRETHSTFDSYCREKWGMSKQQAHRLISAARVAKQVEGILPSRIAEHLTEAAVRPLTFLDEKDATKVMRAVIKQLPEPKSTPGQFTPPTSLTARLVSDTARDLIPSAFRKSKKRKKHKQAPINGEAADFIRRSELLESLDKWEKKNESHFLKYSVSDVLNAVRKLIHSL